MLEIVRDLDRLPIRDRADADRVIRWLARATAGLPAISAPPQLQRGKGYTRTLLHKSDDYELLALHWNPGASTLPHDHGGHQCWFAVVDGEMHVDNFRRLDDGAAPGYARIESLGEVVLNAGGIDYRVEDADVHRCRALVPTLTLQLYAKPLGIYHVFDEKRESCAEATSTYDAIATL
jgi:predicted metal-dependent enzyme (double-stranded beta helix superfamily)